MIPKLSLAGTGMFPTSLGTRKQMMRATSPHRLYLRIHLVPRLGATTMLRDFLQGLAISRSASRSS